METEVIQLLINPVLIAFILLTILAIYWKFFRMWIVSLITVSLVIAFVIIVFVTIAQFVGGDDTIRYIITSEYVIFGALSLTFGNILLILVLVVSFQLALAANTLQLEESFRKRLNWFPGRSSHHYEMENTLEENYKKQW